MPGVTFAKLISAVRLPVFGAIWVLLFYPDARFTCLAQDSNPIRVYVAPFRSMQPISPVLQRRVTDDFEEFLTNSRRYKVLERRSFESFKDQLRSESAILDDPELARKFKENGAQAIMIGRIEHDTGDLSYVFSVTLISITGERLWSKSSTLKQTLIDDRDSRRAAIQKLTPDSTADHREDGASPPMRDVHPSAEFGAEIGSRPRQSSPSRTPIATQSEMGFDITLEKCAKQNGSKVACSFKITNRAGDRPLAMFATTTNRGSTLCVDAEGGQLTATSVALGSFPNEVNVRTTAFSNVTMRGSVVFATIGPNVNLLALLSLRFNAKSPAPGSFPRDFSVEFRSVPVDF